MRLPWVLLLGAAAAAAQPSESLSYTANWPGGVTFGEGFLKTSPRAGGWELELTLDASLPAIIRIVDRYVSTTNGELCSVEFRKESVHGARKALETTEIDPRTGIARRRTGGGGGSSEIAAGPCARDALAYLAFVRREFSAGRLPAATKVLFGAVYEVSLRNAGFGPVSVNGAMVDADRLVAEAAGPASHVTFEVFLARDGARTPVVIRAPFSMGTFSLERSR